MKLLIALLLATSTAVIGCTDTSTGSSKKPLTALDSARDRWGGHELENYTFRFQWVCFCVLEYVRPTRLTVKNGVIVSGVDAESGTPLDSKRLEDFMTINQLFGVIDQAIADSADDIRMSFDPTYGYPNDVYIDLREIMADEERGFIIDQFSE